MKGLRRQRRGGFTLTEILMAIGILGVGMTMVASVFPVAISESRRSDEMTRASLCARSVAAMLRARRRAVIRWALREANRVTQRMPDSALPQSLAVYSPGEFLYQEDRTYPEADYAWDAGHFTAMVYMTPLSETGPWRTTILVMRAQGARPLEGRDYGQWEDEDLVTRAGPGGYIQDTRMGRGEAYLVDEVEGTSASLTSRDIYVAPRKLWTDSGSGDGEAQTTWTSHARAVAAYHTIIGE